MLQAAMVRVAPLKLQSRCLGATAKAGAHQFEPVQKYDPLCVCIYIPCMQYVQVYTYIYILCSIYIYIYIIYIHIVGKQPTKKKLGHHIGEALQNIKLFCCSLVNQSFAVESSTHTEKWVISFHSLV